MEWTLEGGKRFSTKSAFHKLIEVSTKLRSPMLNPFGNFLVLTRLKFFCGAVLIEALILLRNR